MYLLNDYVAVMFFPFYVYDVVTVMLLLCDLFFHVYMQMYKHLVT